MSVTPNTPIHLIVDSSCDLTGEMKEKMNVRVVPLKVRLSNGKEYLDDGNISAADILDEMAATKQGASSACPSTEDFAELMRLYDASFVVTVSSKLSGCYNAARIAAETVIEESPEKRIYVFDSKSASAGEVQVALLLNDLVEQGLSFDEIIPVAEEYIRKMQTLFVVEDLGNFIRNGRLSKVSGLIASVLSLCPILGDNGNGEIHMVAKMRGMQNSLRKLAELVGEMTVGAASKSLRLVLGHCSSPERAAELRRNLLEKCAALREVIVISTGAISSVYANKGGVVVAFESTLR